MTTPDELLEKLLKVPIGLLDVKNLRGNIISVQVDKSIIHCGYFLVSGELYDFSENNTANYVIISS